ncbi:MAG: SUMF1/EgtB/PvdO family nonheme iron enzyme, partial [Thermodesulfobacteriota bacterium]
EIVELGEETPTEGSGPASGSRPSLLDALAEYFDPEQILAADAGETLSEENEEYIAHILGRYTPTFIKIPAGRYRVGSLPPNPQAPLRTVKLPAFYIGQIPVTNDLFELFVRETGYITDAEQQGFGTVFTARQTVHADGRGRRVLSLHRGSRAKRIAGADWRHPGGPATSILGKYNHPVVQVTLQDALAFAAWAGKRLPTVEEWEAAARGSDGRPFPWGPDWVPGLANLEIAMTGDTTPVGGYGRRSAGPFGLLDTLGNVFEWTSSTDARHSNAADSPYLLKGGCWLTADQVDLGVFLSESKDFRANIAGFRLAV